MVLGIPLKKSPLLLLKMEKLTNYENSLFEIWEQTAKLYSEEEQTLNFHVINEEETENFAEFRAENGEDNFRRIAILNTNELELLNLKISNAIERFKTNQAEKQI